MDGHIATECHNEQTPLLHSYRRSTPFPKLQIGILLFLQITEPICSMSIYPYINEVCSVFPVLFIKNSLSIQLVSKLDIIGGDTRKIGYYAGLIVESPYPYDLFMSSPLSPFTFYPCRNPCSLPRRLLQFFNGVEHQTVSVESLFYWLVYLEHSCRCSFLDFLGHFGH